MMRILIIAQLMVLSAAVHAQDVPKLKHPEVRFSEWASKYPQEKQVLSLFRGYTEPRVTFVEDGVKKNALAELTIYVTQDRFTIKKPASAINLASMIKVEVIAKLDPEIFHQPIATAQTMPEVGGRGPVPNFKWCDKGYFSLADYEQNLSHLKGDHVWCAPGGRSICVESCYPFKNALWYNAVAAYNLAKKTVSSNAADLKDYGVAMQSEVRYFVSDAEYGLDVKSLTGINSPVRGIVEINIFYVNQVMQFGKIVAVFQEDPANAQATILTSMVAVGVRSKTLKKYSAVGAVLKGEARRTLNTATGLTAGVPIFARNIAKSIVEILEK